MKNKLLSQNIIRDLFLLHMAFALISCEKVISVDLNSAASRIVIESSISDQPGPYYVMLSQTVNFDQTNTFPPVSGAIVIISDNVGNTDSLTEISPGMYKTKSIQGMPGRTYTIKVKSGGQEYTAISTMPNPVEILSLSNNVQSFGRDKIKYINVDFKDSSGIKNYYRFVEVRNGTVLPYTFLFDDRIQDGGVITSSLLANQDTLNTGDSVVVQLQCIDKGVFDYFRTIRVASGGGGPAATSPANPVSNFTNGALGFFSAYAVRSKLIIIK